MIDAGPSATSAAISTPRFIGPGCMTTVSGLRRAARAADDADSQPAEGVGPEPAAQREEVEQGLGRVLVAAVAGVDDGGVDPRGDPVRRARAAVAHDHRVDAHRLDGADGVEEALA